MRIRQLDVKDDSIVRVVAEPPARRKPSSARVYHHIVQTRTNK